MNISSRTPEGLPNRCPVCGKDVCLEPSDPIGDAPCPHCGHLLHFVVTDSGVWLIRKRDETGQPSAAGASRHFFGPLVPGEQVRVHGGTIENFEGTVGKIDEVQQRLTVLINIFGHQTPLEVELWQVEKV